MDIGIVITLLIFLLSIAGPVIEKQLKKAGKVEQARTLRKITDTISGDVKEETAETSSADDPEAPEIRTEEGSRPVATASVPASPAASGGRPAVPAGQSPDVAAEARAEVMALALEKYRARKKARQLEQTELSRLKSASRTHVQPQEQPSEKRKLDIDPRKLVIYSEIMKPKF